LLEKNVLQETFNKIETVAVSSDVYLLIKF
jgi:hypothetical protein